jgi:hypothetical protein
MEFDYRVYNNVFGYFIRRSPRDYSKYFSAGLNVDLETEPHCPHYYSSEDEAWEAVYTVAI